MKLFKMTHTLFLNFKNVVEKNYTIIIVYKNKFILFIYSFIYIPSNNILFRNKNDYLSLCCKINVFIIYKETLVAVPLW